METRRLELSDETLRDGEQQAGLCFPGDVKRDLTHRIARTGVQRIDLMPAVDESEAELARTLLEEGLASVLSAATMLGRSHVELAKACGFRRIILFYALSDRLLFLRDPELRADPALAHKTIDDDIPHEIVARARENALARALDALRHAAELGLEVDFAAEDASRADRDFLVRCILQMSPWLGHFVLCDTLGVLRPDVTREWVTDLLKTSDHARLGVHFHNDLGLALENTLEAVCAGATLVSGTFRGIGERAGNVALDRVLDGLRFRYETLVEGIDYDAVERVTSRLDALGLRPAPPYSPEAQRHESGIHVHALLQDPRSYCTFPNGQPEIWFGRVSGASNFQYLCERILGRPRPRQEYERLAAALKHRALRESRCYSPEEVMRMLEDGSLL